MVTIQYYQTMTMHNSRKIISSLGCVCQALCRASIYSGFENIDNINRRLDAYLFNCRGYALFIRTIIKFLISIPVAFIIGVTAFYVVNMHIAIFGSKNINGTILLLMFTLPFLYMIVSCFFPNKRSIVGFGLIIEGILMTLLIMSFADVIDVAFISFEEEAKNSEFGLLAGIFSIFKEQSFILRIFSWAAGIVIIAIGVGLLFLKKSVTSKKDFSEMETEIVIDLTDR